MVKLVSLYTYPDDPLAFEARLATEHLPYLRTVPGIQRLRWPAPSVGHWAAPPYYLMVELYFVSSEALQLAIDSPRYALAVRALRFAAGLATVFFAETIE